MTDRADINEATENAERFVAGCVLHGVDEVDAARAVVTETDFYHPGCRVVFRAACELRDAGQEVTAATVHIRLSQTKRLADLGPKPALFLADLMGAAPTPAGLPYAASQVRDAAIRRTLAQLAAELIREATDPTEPAEDIAVRFERRLSEAAAGAVQAHGPVLLGDALKAAMTRYDEAAAGTWAGSPVIPTGFPALDRMLGGFCPGQLCILAARPSVGKSALALQFAEAAAREGLPVLLASLEMPLDDNVDRMVSANAEVQFPRLRGSGQIEPEQADRIAKLFDPDGLAGLPIWIDDRPGRTATAVAATARRWARTHGVKLVVVDYLQLLRPDNPKEPRYLQVGTAAKRLRDMARDAGVAVVCLAQLNREVEGRDGGRPKLSDLRDSGEIEQDADVVMLLHRLDGDELAKVHPVDLIIAKQRNGPTTTVPLDYCRPFIRFGERLPLGV